MAATNSKVWKNCRHATYNVLKKIVKLTLAGNSDKYTGAAITIWNCNMILENKDFNKIHMLSWDISKC